LLPCGSVVPCATELLVGGGDGAGGAGGGHGFSADQSEHGGAYGRVCVSVQEEGDGVEVGVWRGSGGWVVFWVGAVDGACCA